MLDIPGFKKLIASPKRITITTHANPDADALGSSLGLAHLLQGLGHDVKVITPTGYPQFLHWMPGHEEVLVFEDDIPACTQSVSESEIIFCLDFSSLNRIKKMEEPVRSSAAIKVMIDHHLDPEDFAAYTLWDTRAAATAELIYDLIVSLEMTDRITRDMAEVIYAGIMTDTDSFKHPSTTAKVHRTVAALIDKGADVNKVNRRIYDTNSTNRLRFMGYAFLEKLVVKPELKVAYFVVTSEEFQRFQLKSGDTEGLVNYALSIEGIVMATIIIEYAEEVKLSFRSTGDYAVNVFANEHFDGGGHKNASGGISRIGLQKTVKKFETLIESFTKSYLLVQNPK